MIGLDRLFLGAMLLVLLAFPMGMRADDALSERQKIEALIERLEGLKDGVFVRNGQAYDAKAAGQFIRSRWKSREREIKTAADFIEKAASVSSTSGKPYLIRFKDGREVESGTFLRDELKKIEGEDSPSSR